MTTTSSTPISTPPTAAPLLAIFNLVVRYGNIEALHGISLQIFPGQIVSLIGANGAGKSSLLRAISGLIPTHSGTILYSPPHSRPSQDSGLTPQDLSRTPPHRIVSLGISHVPEGRGIFLNMSVQENLELGAYLRHDHHAVAEDLHRVFTLFPRIKERRTQLAATMSGGEQQMLAIGRALMARPRVLLLDEPSLGLAPLLVEQIFTVIRDINQTAGGGGEGGSPSSSSNKTPTWLSKSPTTPTSSKPAPSPSKAPPPKSAATTRSAKPTSAKIERLEYRL
jgi:branched-chain amino acid transport system ATP-binding protein